MSILHSLDLGLPSEVHVYDIAPKRHDGGATVAPPYDAAANDASIQRRVHPAVEPFAATFRWVASLPRELRPLAVLRGFPRIANVLALCVDDLDAMREYLFELLADSRGHGEGFPEDVRIELLRLRAYVDDRNLRSGVGASGAHRA